MLEKSDDTLSRSDTIPERDERTDGRNDRISLSISRVSNVPFSSYLALNNIVS